MIIYYTHVARWGSQDGSTGRNACPTSRWLEVHPWEPWWQLIPDILNDICHFFFFYGSFRTGETESTGLNCEAWYISLPFPIDKRREVGGRVGEERKDLNFQLVSCDGLKGQKFLLDPPVLLRWLLLTLAWPGSWQWLFWASNNGLLPLSGQIPQHSSAPGGHLWNVPSVDDAEA